MKTWSFLNQKNNRTEYCLLSQNEYLENDRKTINNCDIENIGIDNNCDDNNDYDKMKKDYTLFVELVGYKKQLNWKKIGLIGGVAFIIVVIITIVVLMSGGDQTHNGTSPQKGYPVISLEDIIEGRLSPKRFNGTWINDNEITYRDIEGLVKGYNVETGKETIYLGNDNEKLAQGFQFEVSPDKKYLLVGREHQKLFRHSFVALYDIVDLETQEVIPITVNDFPAPLILCQWSPVNNSLIFVFLNNIFYKPSPLHKEIQITEDGGKHIYNGIPDWVYEEEIFAGHSAVWFSPDGKKIAFARFDDNHTIPINIPYYGPPGLIEFQYPTGLSILYPKAGSANPTVKVLSVNLEDAVPGVPITKYNLRVPNELANSDHIITSVSWANNNNIITTWMNRVQNKAIIQNCQMDNCSIVTKIESETGWVELFSAPIYNKNGSVMAIIASQFQGSSGGYRHLTIINRETGKMEPLTKGKYVVQDLLKWDANTNIIFYMANTEEDSQVLHLYAIKGEIGEEPICLTCHIFFNNIRQTYYDAEFSKTGNYIILSAIGPNIPRIDIYSWHLNENEVSLKWVSVWEKNNEIREFLNDKASPNIVHHNILLDSGFTAKVMLLLPPNADLTGNSKYPMLVDVYGGPDSNNVLDKWSMEWGSYLATNRSIIYAKIDGRGSGLRGDKLLHTIYRKLGTVEIEDQIQTTKKLQEKLPYISKEHTGIWGWSYGGYASAMSLALDTEKVFNCAASVAPVTDWTLYDSIYTERFMGLPTIEDNKIGYDKSRLSTLAKQFKGKKYLLVHGTLDDNVHYQQSMALSRSLERSDIMFTQMTYPDEDHGLGGVRPHLYHTLGHFFGECFHINDEL